MGDMANMITDPMNWDEQFDEDFGHEYYKSKVPVEVLRTTQHGLLVQFRHNVSAWWPLTKTKTDTLGYFYAQGWLITAKDLWEEFEMGP